MSRFGGFKSANKKVKNATKTEVDGVVYDSRLEAYMAGLLKRHKIPFELKTKITLQDGFRYGGEAVRAITMYPDFALTINGVYTLIDAKGHANDVFPLKVRLLKKYLSDNYEKSQILLPSNKQECEKVINLLLKELCNAK